MVSAFDACVCCYWVLVLALAASSSFVRLAVVTVEVLRSISGRWIIGLLMFVVFGIGRVVALAPTASILLLPMRHYGELVGSLLGPNRG